MERIVPRDVAAAIVLFSRSAYLRTLCLVSKAFLKPAQRRIYTYFSSSDPYYTTRFLLTITDYRYLADYLRQMRLTVDRRFMHNQNAALPYEYWENIANALQITPNLESLILEDRTSTHTWVLSPDLDCRLRFLELQSMWDAHTARFLASQPELEEVSITRASVNSVAADPLPPGSLPYLRIFDAPFAAATQVLGSPLVCLQVNISSHTEEADTLPHFFRALAGVKTLRSLSVNLIEDTKATELLAILADVAPQLEHLGVVALPAQLVEISQHGEKSLTNQDFPEVLIKLRRMRVLDISVAHWLAPPMPEYHPLLAGGLRTWMPTLSHVMVRMPRERNAVEERYLWKYDTGPENELDQSWHLSRSTWDQVKYLWRTTA